MSTSVGSIHYDLGLDTKEFDRNADSVGDKLSDAGKKFAKFSAIAVAAVTATGFAMKKFLIDPAIDLNESINAVEKTFGKASDAIFEFGKTADKSAGLSKAAFNAAVVPIGAMLQNMGIEQKKAAKESINLAGRAADLASVFNTDLDQALTAIQAGLRGEADPLERFGVQMNETAVKAYALSKGILKSGEEMTATQKATARLGLFFEQTTKYAGDFVDTSDQAANMARINQARFENLRAELGMKLMPAYTKLLEVVSKVIDKFSDIDQVIRSNSGTIGLVVEKVKNMSDGFMLFFNQATAFLLPVFQSLWAVVNDRLIPVLMRLWKDVIEPLLPVIGTSMVFVIGAMIAQFTLAITIIAQVIQYGINLVNAVRGVIDWLVRLAMTIWQNIQPAFQAVGGMIRDVRDWFNGLHPAIKIALAGIYSVITGPFVSAFTFIVNQIEWVLSKLGMLNNKSKETTAAYNKRVFGLTNVPTFSTGGFTGRGSATEAAGIVHKGEYVLPQKMVDQNTGMPKMSSGTNIYGNIAIGSQSDADYFFSRLNRGQDLASMGLAGG